MTQKKMLSTRLPAVLSLHSPRFDCSGRGSSFLDPFLDPSIQSLSCLHSVTGVFQLFDDGFRAYNSVAHGRERGIACVSCGDNATATNVEILGAPDFGILVDNRVIYISASAACALKFLSHCIVYGVLAV